jgi:hypothetical protein
LFKEQRINLEKTPFINWLWCIVNCLSGLNEQRMSGDDYAARIYVVVNGGWHFGKPRRLIISGPGTPQSSMATVRDMPSNLIGIDK